METPCQPTTTNSNVLEPFLLERRLLPKVWGGQALRDVLGIELPPELPQDEAIGEAWELFDRPDGSSKVRGSDTTLRNLVQRDPEALVGRDVPLGHGGSFPLMLKFLDARDGLSIQVHPDDRRAVRDSGKNECCLILHTAPGARVVHGVKPGVTKDEFLAKWQTKEVEGLLYSFEPEVGDLIHIPPGTVHGIGPGVVAFEVQQNSDLTYRFYDWGRGRELHVDQALGVVDVVANHRRPVSRSTALPDGGDLLLSTEHFVVRRYGTREPVDLPTHGRYLTVTVLGGSGRMRWRGSEGEGYLAIAKCDTVLVPACLAAVDIEPDESVDLIVCGPGAG